MNKAEDVQQSWSKKRLISFQSNFMFACWRHVTGAEICKEWSCSSGQNEILWSLSIKKDYDWLVCVCDRKGLVDSFLKVSKWKLRNTLQEQALPALANGWREGCRPPLPSSKTFINLVLPPALFWKVIVGDKVWHHAMPDITWRAACRCMDFPVVSPELLRVVLSQAYRRQLSD